MVKRCRLSGAAAVLAAALAWGGAALPALGQQGAAAGGGITVATYNVHNFFDNFDNPYTADEGTKQKSSRELDQLAEALKIIDADVLVLEEVEAGGFLRQFVRERLGALGYAYVVDESTEDERGIAVAMLSRLPVERIVSHRLTPLAAGQPPVGENRFARDLLRVDVTTQSGQTLSVYGVHFKSKLDAPGDPQGAKWRQAEATKAAELIATEMREKQLAGTGGAFVLAGDFNDTPESGPMQTLYSKLPAVDALAGVPAAQRVTYVSRRYHESIDDIIVAKQLTMARPGEILSEGVFQDASDHRPVRVTVRMPDGSATNEHK